jgi:hypothetical protein
MLAAVGGGALTVSGLRRATGARELLSLSFFLLVLLARLAVPGVALGAETTINFDGLKAGELVKAEYEAQGLKMGTAAEVGFPGVATADCGAPTVTGGTGGTPAASAPNYASLASCPSGRGTYGALLGHARGALAVDVRNRTIGVGPVNVELVGYDSAGHELVKGQGEALSTEWKRIPVTISGQPKIAYFLVAATDAAQPGELGIDDLGYEALGEEPPGGAEAAGRPEAARHRHRRRPC